LSSSRAANKAASSSLSSNTGPSLHILDEESIEVELQDLRLKCNRPINTRVDTNTATTKEVPLSKIDRTRSRIFFVIQDEFTSSAIDKVLDEIFIID